MDLTFDDVYKIPLFSMKIIDILRPEWTIWVPKLLIQHIIYSYDTWLMGENFIREVKNKDYPAASRYAIYLVVYILVTQIASMAILNKKRLISLLGKLRKDYDKTFPKEEMDIILKYREQTNLLHYRWALVTAGCSGLTIVKHFVLQMYTLIKGEFVYLELFPMEYSPIIEENKQTLPVFLYTYLLFLFNCYYLITVYLAFMPIGTTTTLHLCSYLEIVERRLENLFENEEEADAKIREIIPLLQDCYSIVDDINAIYMITNEVLLKHNIVVLPFCWWIELKLLTGGEGINVEMMQLIFTVIWNTGLQCYGGEVLKQKGEDVAFSIYACNWEKSKNLKIRKTILFMIARSQKPTIVKAFFNTMCLETFTLVANQCYIIVNLMNAKWD